MKAQRSTGRRRLLASLATLACGALMLLGPAPAAQAHAFLSGSNPGDGQVLSEAPRELRLDFSESVVVSATRIDIVDSAGRHFAPAHLRLNARPSGAGEAADTEQPVQLLASLPSLPHSAYRVQWETLSSDDLHRTAGVFVFGIQHAVTAAGLSEPAPRPGEAGLRWLVLLGMSMALGGSLAGRLLRRHGCSAAELARCDRMACSGALGAAAAAGVLLVVQLAQDAASVTGVLGGSYGGRWALREVGLVLLACAAVLRLRRSRGTTRARRPRVTTGLLLAGATLTSVGSALLGHSGAGATPDATRVAASALHLVAATTWAGGLGSLALVLLRRRRTAAWSAGVARRLLRGFGPPAAACVSVMVVTGLYLSSDVVGSVDAALTTTYGRTLLLKLALAALAGALALVNTLRLRRRGNGRRPPRRTVLAEAAAAIGVLALAAVLTSGQPAMEPQLVQVPPAPSGIADRQVGDLQEALSVQPNRPGANVVMVDVFATRRPDPGPVRQVVVSAVPAQGTPTQVDADPLPDRRWSAALTLSGPGVSTLRVTVRRAGLPDVTQDYHWQVGGATVSGRPTVVSRAPLRPVLREAAVVVLLLVALVWLAGAALPVLRGGAGRRRRAPQDPPTPPAGPAHVEAGAEQDLAEQDLAEVVRLG